MHNRIRMIAVIARSVPASIAAMVVAVAAALSVAVPVSVAAEPTAPANNDLAAAQIVHSLPATLRGTTVGATTEPGEAQSACGQFTVSSVWYSLRSSAAQRLAVNLAAGGRLDATIDVYHAVRSQLKSVGCQQTDSHGKAALTFKASKNGVYEIRVAALQSSQLAGFTLEVFLPTPAVNPPGPALPSRGASGQVDRIQNVNAAYSFTLHSGVSYLINLANQTDGACVSGALFAPGTDSFEDGSSLLRVGCGGYRLFTPGPGKGGLYSFEVTPSPERKGEQRYHLQVAQANSSETAPGVSLGNYAHARGRLNGSGIQVLRLYRMDVTSHSNLTLKLGAPDSADFNLQLRSQSGSVIECSCGDSGAQTLQRQLQPGTYYAVVSVRDASAGNFTLVRESRTITATKISFGSSTAGPGQDVGIDVKVSPAASGPVKVLIERFDPVFGWQFYRQSTGEVSGGSASVAFTPPAVGRWRAEASYEGSRTASASGTGFVSLLVR
jgi:hypothetical protein